MGPNGAGKSTLLRTARRHPRARSRGRSTHPVELRCSASVPTTTSSASGSTRSCPAPAGRAALAAVGLDVPGAADPRDLSGGERQRLALAIAMAGRGAGGEPERARLPRRADPRASTAAARRTWRAGSPDLAAGGAGAAVATHDVEFAARFATRVVLLARGRVIADGEPLEVLGGGWYFATETARITGGRAITPEDGAAPADRGCRAGAAARDRDELAG